MTREQLDALEKLLQHATTEAPEVLDAIRSSIAQAREALELREALDAARAQGRREGPEEAKQSSPIAWRYKVLVNKHSSGEPLPGEIFMLDICRTKVWGIPGAWRYSDGPGKPDVDWMCEAEPLFASQEPTA